MQYFKYLLFIILTLITTTSYSAYTCGVGANVTLTTDLEDYPSVICANTGAGNCEVIEDHSIRSNDGSWIIYATSTGEGCTTPTNLNAPPLADGCVRTPNGSIQCEEEQEEEEEENPVLQCSTDSCPNPDNKRCPTGYTRGSFNGQNLCVKSQTQPECNDPNGCDESQDESQEEIISAIDRANNDITNSNNSIIDTLNQGFENIKNALNGILDKIGELSDSISGTGNNNNDGSENQNESPDTSGFNADLPLEDKEINQNIETGLYTVNTQCPAKKIIDIPQYGLHYEFDFSEICNTLQMFGYLVLIFSYVVAARIVVKA